MGICLYNPSPMQRITNKNYLLLKLALLTTLQLFVSYLLLLVVVRLVSTLLQQLKNSNYLNKTTYTLNLYKENVFTLC